VGSKGGVGGYGGGYLRQGTIILPCLPHSIDRPISKRIPIATECGVNTLLGCAPFNRLGVGYKARGVGQLLHLVEHTVGIKRKEYAPKNRPAYLADSYLGISLILHSFSSFLS
jgi:hypothetical protein